MRSPYGAYRLNFPPKILYVGPIRTSHDSISSQCGLRAILYQTHVDSIRLHIDSNRTPYSSIPGTYGRRSILYGLSRSPILFRPGTIRVPNFSISNQCRPHTLLYRPVRTPYDSIPAQEGPHTISYPVHEDSFRSNICFIGAPHCSFPDPYGLRMVP